MRFDPAPTSRSARLLRVLLCSLALVVAPPLAAAAPPESGSRAGEAAASPDLPSAEQIESKIAEVESATSLNDADKAALTKVLTYHVVPGTVMAADVKTGAVKTVEGQSLNIVASSTGVTVNDAKVTKTDIVASNGVIHVIDTVVLPM